MLEFGWRPPVAPAVNSRSRGSLPVAETPAVDTSHRAAGAAAAQAAGSSSIIPAAVLEIGMW